MVWNVRAVPDTNWKVLGHDLSRSDLNFPGTVSLELMIFTLPLKRGDNTICLHWVTLVTSAVFIIGLNECGCYQSCPSLWIWTPLRGPYSAGWWRRCTAAQQWRHLPLSLLSEVCLWKILQSSLKFYAISVMAQIANLPGKQMACLCFA